MDFRLCTLCIVAVVVFFMVDQLKADESTETEPQETAWSDSIYEAKKRTMMKENSKLERSHQLDGKKKKYKKQFEDMNAFNKYKKNHKDQKPLKKERKHLFEKNKVKEEIYANGYVDNWETLNDKKKTTGKKFSGDQTVELPQSKAKQLKKQEGGKGTEGSSEYENQKEEVRKLDGTVGKKQKKGRCSLSDEMHTCDSYEMHGRHSKYIKKLKNKSEHFENSLGDTSENIDELSASVNLENCETADSTENNLKTRNGRKIKRMYVVEDKYEDGINEEYSAEINEEEDDMTLYNLDENKPLKPKGKIRRYIIEEEFIEDLTEDE